MVATLGETTGVPALRNILRRMQNDPVGRDILEKKPRYSRHLAKTMHYLKNPAPYFVFALSSVTKESIQFDKLLSLPEDTLGGAYARWMQSHYFSPDER